MKFFFFFFSNNEYLVICMLMKRSSSVNLYPSYRLKSKDPDDFCLYYFKKRGTRIKLKKTIIFYRHELPFGIVPIPVSELYRSGQVYFVLIVVTRC